MQLCKKLMVLQCINVMVIFIERKDSALHYGVCYELGDIFGLLLDLSFFCLDAFINSTSAISKQCNYDAIEFAINVYCGESQMFNLSVIT